MAKLGLALGGGGAKGSYQIGVLKALYEHGLLDKLKVVSGTSVGAINACMVMESQNYQRLSDIWDAMTNQTIYKDGISRFKTDKMGLVDQKIMYQVLTEMQSKESIQKSRITGYAAVTKINDYHLTKQLNTETMESILVKLNEQDEPHKYVLASASVPIIFGPTEINGDYYVDGGLLNNVPINALKEEACNIMIVIGLSPYVDIEQYNDGKTLIIDFSPQKKLTKTTFGMLDFSPKVTQKRAELGYKHANEMISYLIGKKVIVDGKWYLRKKGLYRFQEISGNVSIVHALTTKVKTLIGLEPKNEEQTPKRNEDMKLIDAKLVLLDLEVKHKDDLFNVLTTQLFDTGRINNFKDVYQAFWDRENIISTGIGKGVAIPHAKSESVVIPTLTFARLKTPILYQSLDDNPVNLIFMISMPEKKEQLHLKVLSQIATKLLDESIKDIFLNAKDEKEIFAILKDIEKEAYL